MTAEQSINGKSNRRQVRLELPSNYETDPMKVDVDYIPYQRKNSGMKWAHIMPNFAFDAANALDAGGIQYINPTWYIRDLSPVDNRSGRWRGPIKMGNAKIYNMSPRHAEAAGLIHKIPPSNSGD